MKAYKLEIEAFKLMEKLDNLSINCSENDPNLSKIRRINIMASKRWSRRYDKAVEEDVRICEKILSK